MIEIGELPILVHIMKGYAAQGFNDFIILAGYKQRVIKEKRDNIDDDKGRDTHRQRGYQRAEKAAEVVSDIGGGVDGDGAGGGLRNGDNIEKFLVSDPLFLFHNFVLNHGQHYIPSANGEKPYAEKRNKKTPICRHHCCL